MEIGTSHVDISGEPEVRIDYYLDVIFSIYRDIITL